MPGSQLALACGGEFDTISAVLYHGRGGGESAQYRGHSRKGVQEPGEES